MTKKVEKDPAKKLDPGRSVIVKDKNFKLPTCMPKREALRVLKIKGDGVTEIFVDQFRIENYNAEPLPVYATSSVGCALKSRLTRATFRQTGSRALTITFAL